MKILVSKFKGLAPKISPMLLNSEYAQICTNLKLTSGNLNPIHESIVDLYLDNTKTYNTLYKYNYSDTYKWLVWESFVNLAKDPIFNDTYNRTIITGLDVPRVFDSSMIGSANTITSSNSYKLGIYSPDKPTMTVGGSGSGTAETRAYAIAYGRKWTDNKLDVGPWSAPAETSGGAAYVDVLPGQYVDISNIKDVVSGYGLNTIEIYRTASGTTTTNFQLVISFDITAGKAGTVPGVTWNSGTSIFTYRDSLTSASLGDIVNNQLWIAPPDGMNGIVSLQNNILAGFYNNSVYFSEPGQFHAWPEAYRVAIDRNIIGLGTYGNTLVVCTDAEPHIITVSDPASAVAYPIKDNSPCVNGNGIVSFKDSVVFPSYEGFIKISSLGIDNITSNIADSEDMKQFNISTMIGVGLDDIYYGFYIDLNSQRRLLMLDLNYPEDGFIEADFEATAAYVDKPSSTIYICRKFTENITAIAAYNSATNPMRFIWKSKKFSTHDDTLNFSAARIRFKAFPFSYDESLSDEDIIASINTRYVNEYPINGVVATRSVTEPFIVFKWYVDDELVFTKNVVTTRPFRLPAGKIGNYYEFEISGYAPVFEVAAATSMQELSPTS